MEGEGHFAGFFWGVKRSTPPAGLQGPSGSLLGPPGSVGTTSLLPRGSSFVPPLIPPEKSSSKVSAAPLVL